MSRKNKSWIGVDLDGTLAHYDGKWRGAGHIGEPIPAMVERIKAWRAEGKTVKIFTARAGEHDDLSRAELLVPIEQWCQQQLGEVLPIVCAKDMFMSELWDDRATQVIPNEGKTVEEATGELIRQLLDRLWAVSEGHRATREEIVKIKEEFFS